MSGWHTKDTATGGLCLSLNIPGCSFEHRLHTRHPKGLGHFLNPHISKTTMHSGKFETYKKKQRKKLGKLF